MANTTNGDDNSHRVVEMRKEVMASLSQSGQNPILRDGYFLNPYFPLNSDKPLPNLPAEAFTNCNDSNKSSLKVEFNGWQKTHQEWCKWVERLQPQHEATWRRVGILEAIKTTSLKIHQDIDLILGLAQKWHPETNSFIFRWGEASVTLEDVCVLGGFSVTGDYVSVSVPADMVVAEDRLLAARRVINRSSSKKCTYKCWLKHFTDNANGFNDVEHEAFLVFWLSKFVFPKVKDSVGKHVQSIAIQLAKGIRVALAPAVLAALYMDLGRIKKASSRSSHNQNSRGKEILESWSLMHLVQAWAWERFPTLGLNPNPIRAGEPRISQWHDLEGNLIDGVGGVLDASMEEFRWRPYCTVLDNWSFNEFYLNNKKWVEVKISKGQEMEHYAMFIRHSELVCLEGFIEPYLPHRVAMQFGMDQDVPSLVPRFNKTVESAKRHYNRSFGDKEVYIPPRLMEADVALRYSSWWKRARLPQPDSEDKMTISELLRKYRNGKVV